MRFGVFICMLLLLSSCSFSPKTTEQDEKSYTCSVAWELVTGFSDLSNMMCMNGNSLYIVTGADKVNTPHVMWKVNLDTGKKVWETIEVKGNLQSIIQCGSYVFAFANNESNMLCFDDSSGELLATVQFDEDAELAKYKTVWLGNVVSDGDLLVWGACEGLFSFDITQIDYAKPVSDTQIIPPVCLYVVPAHTGIAATPIIEDHLVYFMRCAYMDRLGENTIAAYNLLSSTLVWERKSNKMTGLVCDGMIIDGEWLYIIDAYGSTCLNKKTGGKDAFTNTGERWVNNGDDEWGAIFAAHHYGQGLVIDNGRMYFTTSASSNTWSALDYPKSLVKNILCLNCEDGTMLWGDMPRDSLSLGARPAIANQKLYVSRQEGLRIYKAETGQLLGVDENISSSGVFSRNLLYEPSNFIILNGVVHDSVSRKLIAIRAE